MILAQLASTLCLLAPLQGRPAITCQATISTWRGVVGTLTLRTRAGERAEITQGDHGHELKFTITPNLRRRARVDSRIVVKISEHHGFRQRDRHEERANEHSQSRESTFEVNQLLGKPMRYIINNRGLRILKPRQNPELGKDDLEVELTETVSR